MVRAPFQILVLPYRRSTPREFEYAVFLRADEKYWQFIAGGGEDSENPDDAARREAFEEAGIPLDADYTVLDSRNTVPVVGVTGKFTWGKSVFVIPEYVFGVKADGLALTISREHTGFRWVNYQEAAKMLKWDSNKNALWELNARLTEKT